MTRTRQDRPVRGHDPATTPDFNGQWLTIRQDDSVSWPRDGSEPEELGVVLEALSPARQLRNTARLRLRDASTVADPSQDPHPAITYGRVVRSTRRVAALIEGAFPVSIHVRGNEITVRGDDADAERAARLFEEISSWSRAMCSTVKVGRSIQMLKRPTPDRHPHDVRCSADESPCVRRRRSKRYVDSVPTQYGHLCDRSRGTVATWRSRCGSFQPKEVHRIILTGRRWKGERLWFPSWRHSRGRPVPASAVRRAYDMLEPEAVSRLLERTIEVAARSCAGDAQRLVHHLDENTTPEQMKMFLTASVDRRSSSPAMYPDRSPLKGADVPGSPCAISSWTSTISSSSSSTHTTSCAIGSCKTS